MTLGELIDRLRASLADESVGIRRSWEDMFRYTLKHYPTDTPVSAFDLDILSSRMIASGMNPPIVAGYVRRWREVLARPR